MDKKNEQQGESLTITKTTVKNLQMRIRTGVQTGRPTMTGRTVCNESGCGSSRSCT